MEKKYELTDEAITIEGITLHRIRAIKSFGIVRAGDLGGFIEGELNLSHMYDCWVAGDAMVYGKAKISGDARVSGNAKVYGNAHVTGYARICGYARVLGGAEVSDNTIVCGYEEISC